MLTNPLAPPALDTPALPTFLTAYHLQASTPPVELLHQVATAFAQVPYENLTKIIKAAQAGQPSEARRDPIEVVSDHVRWGTGGTCFSLTSTLLHLVRALGWHAEPLLADRWYGADTHSGLLVWLDGEPHLLDPGYLLVKPVPLPKTGQVRIATAFNEVVLTARDEGRKIDLHTVQQGQSVYRLTFKTQPVEPSTFLRAWDTSFDAEMMRAPVLTRVIGPRQLYLHQNRLQVRERSTVQKIEVDPQRLAELMAQEFGVAVEVAAQALAVLRRQGEKHG